MNYWPDIHTQKLDPLLYKIIFQNGNILIHDISKKVSIF